MQFWMIVLNYIYNVYYKSTAHVYIHRAIVVVRVKNMDSSLINRNPKRGADMWAAQLLFFFKASLSGYRCSIYSCTRTEVHHTLTPLHTYTDLHLQLENKIASFVILTEPA